MYARTLAALAILVSAAAPCAATGYAPGSQVSLEGKVSALQSQRAFWLDVEDARVLVYTTNAQQQLLYVGQVVRVDGRVSDDYIKVAEVEVTARTIKSQRAVRALSASAMQTP